MAARLQGDAFHYFRFLNAQWAQAVCESFADELPALPATRLHGDAHVEQYAFTSTARGLDDFDDSALGPSVVDLVRFLGSIDLAARARGWQARETMLSDRFLSGYRRGLADRGYLPPEPAVVQRLRAARMRDPAAFLAWADSLMERVGTADVGALDASLQRLDRLVRRVRPDLPTGYLRSKKVGWLHIGLGSALTRKALVRVEGPGPSPDDDVVLEGKQLSDLRGVPCLTVPRSGEVYRVITGTTQLGRLRHEILAIVPRPPIAAPDTLDWWVRSWDPSYSEVTLRDYASVEELADVVHDAGAQLGTRGLREADLPAERQTRQGELDALARLEPRIRSVARQLASELVEQWETFRAGRTPLGEPRR